LKVLVLTILVIYGLALFFILAYSLSQLQLWITYKRKKPKTPSANYDQEAFTPFVTIQLPIFNEYYVVNRLLDAVANFDYPSSRYEIQALDDSTDETVDLVAEKVAELQNRGLECYHIQRNNRVGYKAGALQNGLEQAKGDYIAIFDADFLPKPNFLKATLPLFHDQSVGLVQTRWQHLNAQYSIFTKAQAMALDNHFQVEQEGRNRAGYFMNFNGTAGIWRKSTIYDAGGWHMDTLTEDLDLSYRAQLRKWQFRYLGDVGSPAELPAEINAIKSQQFRWTKGGAETALKIFPKVLRSQLFTKSQKLQAFFHLFNSAIFVCILTCALLSIPALVIKNAGYFPMLFQVATGFLLSLMIIAVIYFDAFRRNYESSWKALKTYLWLFPLFLSITMGLSLHNGWAVIKAWLNVKTPFVRTPKFNLRQSRDNWKGKKYLKESLNSTILLELGLTAYFIFGAGLAFLYGDFGLFPFHLMLITGFGSITVATIYHTLSSNAFQS
jgi:cellulose synthase/poly-beta-1,6-N-acetylglucosamine synthase-like glycosyltransferase